MGIYLSSSPEINTFADVLDAKSQDIKPQKGTGPLFNIKISYLQYRKYHCENKTISRPSYLHNGICYTGKTTFLC